MPDKCGLKKAADFHVTPITPEGGLTIASKLVLYCGIVWAWGQFWLQVLEDLLGEPIKETVWKVVFFVMAWWALNGLITFYKSMKKEEI